MEYIYLTFFWSAWCVLHSLLISQRVTEFFKNALKQRYKYYRLFYNLFSLISFLAIGWYEKTLPQITLFKWQGKWILLRITLVAAALFFFYLGAKNYDMKTFLGLKQIRKNQGIFGLGSNEKLVVKGVLRWVRHPWYLATLLILWSYFNVLYQSTFISIILLSVYTIIGMLLEERKLISLFGEEYQKYRQTVPAIIPWKKPAGK